MQSKIFGIPLVLILLVLMIAIVIDIPLAAVNRGVSQKLNRIELMVNEVNEAIKKKEPAPVISPTEVPKPSPKIIKSGIIPSSQSATKQ